MDRSLDEIIAERPSSSNRGRGRSDRSDRSRRNNWPRDGVKKSSRPDRADLNLDWVHDKFEDDRDTRSSKRASRPSRMDRYSPEPEPTASGAKIRVNNLHYDLTEGDLEDLFTRIGPIISLSLRYDRAGRSEGVAYVVYKRLVDAQAAVREFDGANAKGQPISLTLVSSAASEGRRRNPFDYAEKPKGSLFERTERPRSRDTRSLSPEKGSESGERIRRSDVSKPPPEHIDRYVPGQRSPRRRNDGGRNRGGRPAEGRDNRDRNGSAAGRGRRTANGRPKKTQEELDQEMEDYWGTGTPGNNTSAPQATEQSAAAPVSAGQTADDDIDMIE